MGAVRPHFDADPDNRVFHQPIFLRALAPSHDAIALLSAIVERTEGASLRGMPSRRQPRQQHSYFRMGNAIPEFVSKQGRAGKPDLSIVRRNRQERDPNGHFAKLVARSKRSTHGLNLTIA